MDWLVWVWFVAGLGMLVIGADWLVRGAARLAAAAGISSLVIGLTVVAFGTSAPELAVSVEAAWIGQQDMAVGNVVGSNVFNVLFILGVAAAITPLVVARDVVRRDVPVMVVLSIVLWRLCSDGHLARFDAALMFAGLCFYTWWILRASRRELREQAHATSGEADTPAPRGHWAVNVGWVLAGLALLVVGSQLLVDSAVTFARWAGISEVVVGLTIVAAGTSLPELATSVIAAMRGERDIAVGNVVGSNIFNIMGVLGLSGLVSPGGLTIAPSMVAFDLPVMIAAAIACLPVFARGRTLPRWEGCLFLAGYVAYVAYLLLDATKHEAKDGYATVMLEFVIPLVGLTLGVLAWQVWRPRRA